MPLVRKTFALLIAVLAICAGNVHAAGHPPNPHAEHAFYKRLCSSVRFTFRIPANGDIYIDEWVNGHEITAWGDGPKIIYFFGKNVSGRWVQIGPHASLVQAVHFAAGCVQLKVTWNV